MPCYASRQSVCSDRQNATSLVSIVMFSYCIICFWCSLTTLVYCSAIKYYMIYLVHTFFCRYNKGPRWFHFQLVSSGRQLYIGRQRLAISKKPDRSLYRYPLSISSLPRWCSPTRIASRRCRWCHCLAGQALGIERDYPTSFEELWIGIPHLGGLSWCHGWVVGTLE